MSKKMLFLTLAASVVTLTSSASGALVAH